MRATAPAAPDLEAFLAAYQQRDLLRFLTCGSVDDGKSTLIGRLLHDSAAVYDDQLATLKRATARHGTTGREMDFALLLDGLQAEREQGITIDVAYRYFSTPRRKFIIADTPGHEQYTRNMATGASNCDLAVILVDARQGVLEQTRRHAFIASLLGIQHLVLAVNKMDLVGYEQEPFEAVRSAFTDFAARLQTPDIHFIPISALEGDNIVTPSEQMPWYQGGSLLSYLETVHIAGDRNLIDLRFPIQLVQRPNADFRGYSGTLAAGVLRRGSEVLALPSGKRSRVRGIHTFDGDLEEAFAPQAITVTLEDEVDLSRGTMLVAPANTPHLDHAFEAMLVWMTDEPLATDREYLLKHAAVQTPARVRDIRYRIDVADLHRQPADKLALNEIGRVRVECSRPIAFDPYRKCRETGSFILIDRLANTTVAAGVILEREPAEARLERNVSPDAGTNVRASKGHIDPAARLARAGQRPATVWLTGLPRAGKTTLAFALEERLFAAGHKVQVLDGEGLRAGLNADLGFSRRDRQEQARRTAELARLLNDQGFVVVAALVSPNLDDREVASRVIGAERFLEVWCDAPLEVCEARDTDGLYRRARAGEIHNVTGIDAVYEAPSSPALVVPTDRQTVDQSVEELWRLLASHGLV
jgi:bifunctional enzyme CysN/CysC